MAPPRRYWVKLSLPQSFLATLPHFPTPISKSRLKKIAAEERKANASSGNNSNSTSKVSSPAPSVTAETNNTSGAANNGTGGAAISNFKINSGLKESSTSGLTMNSISNGLYALDKSGKPCRKWVKKPAQFKTFSGFKIKYVRWKHRDQQRKNSKANIVTTVVKNENLETPSNSTALNSASATPDVRSEA